MSVGKENAQKRFLHKLFRTPQGSWTSRQNSQDIPDSSFRNPLIGNGQLSLIFGVPKFCVFFASTCLLNRQRRRSKKLQKLGTPKIRDSWPFPTQGRQTFEGGRELFGHLHVEDPHPTGRSPDPKRYPKGPKIKKFQDRPPGLKFSSGIENFKRATRQTPILRGEFWRSGLNISILIDFFQSLGP